MNEFHEIFPSYISKAIYLLRLHNDMENRTLRSCPDLYNHVSIDWNGDWYTCCFPSGERIYRVGNIVSDDFRTIWNGEKYRYCRRLLRTGKSGVGYTETMCHDCTGVYPRSETRHYWK